MSGVNTRKEHGDKAHEIADAKGGESASASEMQTGTDLGGTAQQFGQKGSAPEV